MPDPFFLNPFSTLLYPALAPFILRVVLGFIYLDIGTLNLKKTGNFKLLGLVEIIGAVMLFLGFYTQIAAIVFILIAGTSLYIEYKDATVLRRDIGFYLLLLAISISLLLSGAGAYAKDLPL